MIYVYFEGVASHDINFLLERVRAMSSGISSDNTAKSLKFTSHNLQSPEISLFYRLGYSVRPTLYADCSTEYGTWVAYVPVTVR